MRSWCPVARLPVPPSIHCAWLTGEVCGIEVHLAGEQCPFALFWLVRGGSLEAVALIELPGAIGIGEEIRLFGTGVLAEGACRIEQRAAYP